MIRTCFALALSASVAAPAFAGNAVVGATGGYEWATGRWFSGLELAMHSSQTRGFGLTGRLDLGWAPWEYDPGPFGLAELGFTGVAPQREATIRLGLTARATVLDVDYPMPVSFAETSPGNPAFGFTPAILAVAELEWFHDAPLTVGGKFGPGFALYAPDCDVGANPSTCGGSWTSGLVGGVYGRVRLKNGLSAELLLGPDRFLTLGYGFPVGKKKAAAAAAPAEVPASAAQE